MRAVPLLTQLVTINRAYPLDKTITEIIYHHHTYIFIFIQSGSSMESPDDHYAGSKCPTQVAMASPNASRKARCHFTCPIVQITQNLLAHGEHDGFRSVVASINESLSPNCYLVTSLFIIKHNGTPFGLQLIFGILAKFCSSLGWRACQTRSGV